MDTPRANLTDREMLLVLADQMRRMEATMDRLSGGLEARLAQGDRRFSDLETRMVNSDQRHTASNTAINSLSGRVLDMERAMNGDRAVRVAAENELKGMIKALDTRQETFTDEWGTWKTRAQTLAWVAGGFWAFVTFLWPFLPRLLQIVNGGTP